MIQSLFDEFINFMSATIQLYFDEITNLENFLYELEYECHSLDDSSQWIKMIYCHLADETLEWANNDEKMTRIFYNAYHDVAIANDANKLNQFLENRFVASLSYRIAIFMKIKQAYQEFIENYYIRVNIIFRHVENRNRIIDQYSNLNHEQSCCFVDTIYWFVDDLRNVKLRRNIIDTFQNMFVEDRSIISFESICITIQLKRIMTKRTRNQFRMFRNQFVTSQVDTDINIVVDKFSSVLMQISCDISEICIAENITNIEICTKSTASKFVKWIIFFTSLQKSLFDIKIVYESSSVLMQIRFEISKINVNIVNSNDIESIDEIFAFESRKWFAFTTSLFEIFDVYESSSILEKIQLNISEISTIILNASDNESIDEIFAFEFDKWIVVVANKKIFDFIDTFDETAKNLLALDIESISNISFDWSRCCTVDMKISKKEIFEFTRVFAQKSKNSLASYFKHIEISIVVNMSFFEYFINENDFAIEIFDFDIALNASSKISLIQHIENLKTLKKNSIYIYEFSALFVFDFSIDIDFEIYTIDSIIITSINQIFVTSSRRKMQLSSFRDFALRNISFDWNRSCTNFIDRRIFSISICIFVSNVIFVSNIIFVDTVNIEFYEKKQFFCFIDIFVSTFIEIVNIEFCEKKQLCCFIDDFVSISIEISDIDFFEKKQSMSFCLVESFVSVFIESVVSENIDFYEKKQSCFSVDDIVDIDEIDNVVVTRIDALALIVDMIKKKKKKKSDWTSFLDLILLLVWVWIEYLITSKHKRLSKMKIKRLSKTKHIESENQSIVAEIFIEFTYKMIAFSNISTIVNTSEISVVFAYKMILFFDNMQNSKFCKIEILESTYDFDVSNLQNNHLISCNCDENKVLFLWILDIFRYLFYESFVFTRTTWSSWFSFRCQYCHA